MAEKGREPQIIVMQREGSLTVDLFFLIGVAGCSFFLSWMMILLGSNMLSVGTNAAPQTLLFLRMMLVAGSIVSCLLNCTATRQIFATRRYLPFVALILSTPLLWVGLGAPAEQPFALLAAAWFITGFALVFMAVQWSEFVFLLRLGRSKLFYGLSMFLATLWTLVMLSVNPLLQPWIVYTIPLFSMGLLLFLRKYYRHFRDLVFIDRKTSFARMRLSWKPVLSTVVTSTALGIALALYYSFHAHEFMSAQLFLALMAAAVLLFMVIDSVSTKRLGETYLIRSFLILSTIGLLPLLFLGQIGTIFTAVLICGMMISVVNGNSAISEHARLFNLAPMQTIAFGRMFSYLGVLLGFVLGYLAYWTQLFGGMTLTVVVAVLMVVFVVHTIFVMMENHYPLDEDLDVQGDIVHVSVSLEDAFQLAMTGEKNAEPEKLSEGAWKRKCRLVAESYGLSTRQSEVLFFLAKGRNAEWITSELVISQHTAKAHIYNIYLKLGVHSRQELIDLVEAVHAEDEAAESSS